MSEAQPILFLWDIDGTLLQAGTTVHRAAFDRVFREVYDLPLSLDGIPVGGRTDTWLLAEPLRRLGMPDADIRSRMPAAFDFMEAYVETHLGDLRDRVAPGIPAVLEALQARGYPLALLTGNLHRIALAKIRHAGLDRYFAVGGFGEESEVRSHLVPVAIARASERAGHPIPPHDVVVIGDTPLDVEAGKLNGTRTVAVATGVLPYEALVSCGPDLLLNDFSAGSAAVEALVGVVPRAPLLDGEDLEGLDPTGSLGLHGIAGTRADQGRADR